jgi:hypothetical protein
MTMIAKRTAADTTMEGPEQMADEYELERYVVSGVEGAVSEMDKGGVMECHTCCITSIVNIRYCM